jgi:hypothetical protein
MQRRVHNIEDELVFSNHTGYVFHESRGFEEGSEDELRIVQEFVHRKLRERHLKDRLHAIWFAPFGICNCKSTKVSFSGIVFRWTMTGQS